MSALWPFFFTIYLMIGAFFFGMTFMEGQKESSWDLWRVSGLLLCLIWPALVIWVFLDGTKVRQDGD